MNWINAIQSAINYVEDHITEPIDYEEVAKCACSSSFHFQRIFSILCGMTLGEYIRVRRLSLAGSELASTHEKVLDVAMKYQYDTVESFCRAFTKFHGVSPSKAKNVGVCLKSFSRLSVKLILDGENTMDYRVETKDAFEMIVRKKYVSSKAEATTAQISDFWQQCGTDGTIDMLASYISDQNIFGNGIVASFGKDASDIDFPYGIGTPYNGGPIKEGLVVEKIPAHTYLVFQCVGKMPQTFQKLYHELYTEFFPGSEYQPCNGTDFEVYPSADVMSPDYTCEFWVSVEKKN